MYFKNTLHYDMTSCQDIFALAIFKMEFFNNVNNVM